MKKLLQKSIAGGALALMAFGGLTAQAADPTLYVRGDMNGWGTNDVMVSQDNNIYTYQFENVAQGEATFKIADSDWGANNYGGTSMNVYSNRPGIQTLENGSIDNIKITNWEGGPMEITFNLQTKELEVKGENQPAFSDVTKTYTAYFEAPEYWENVYVYYWDSNVGNVSWPGEQLQANNEGLYVWNFELPESESPYFGGIIFDAGQDMDQTANYYLYVEGATYNAYSGFKDGDFEYPELFARGLVVNQDGWPASDQVKMTQFSDAPYFYAISFEDNTATEFKIADSNWSTYNFGVGDNVPNLDVYANVPKNVGLVPGGGNVVLNNWGNGTLNLTFNLLTRNLEIAGPDQPKYYSEKLWVPGIGGNWGNWDEMNTLERVEETSVYTGTFEVTAPEEGNLEFKLTNDESWNINSWGTLQSNINVYSDKPYSGEIVNGGDNFIVKNWVTGTMTLTVDIDEMTIEIEGSNQPAAPVMVTYKVYAYNLTEWNPTYLYLWDENGDVGNSWPGFAPAGKEIINELEYTYYNVELPEEIKVANLIFNNYDKAQVELANVTLAPTLYYEVTLTKVTPIDPATYTPSDAPVIGKYTVYAYDQTDWEDLYLYIYSGNNTVGTAWPGIAPATTETINGNVFNVYNFEAEEGSTVNLIFNNKDNGKQVEYAGYVLEDDIYLEVMPTVINLIEDPNKFNPGEVIEYDLFLRGTMNNWNAMSSYALVNTENAPNVYTGSFMVYKPTEGNLEFKLGSNDWNGEYNLGVASTSETFEAYKNQPLEIKLVNKDSANIVITNWNGGMLNLSLNIDTFVLTINSPDQDNTTGIVSILDSLNGDEVIYNLQGVKVDRNNMKAGIYIINGKKVMVK
ncbi:MAG: starch-binding protein [Muribaculaceae bacterium]|nr:starch-binding protein [Muribaculaceae bacterium]